MTDIVITATSVVPASDATIVWGYAGEAITAGQAVYKSSTTGKWMKADANSATAEARAATHVALCGSSASQPIAVGRGDITIGATLTAGLAYYLSDTPGGICPVADIGAGEYVCLIGLAKSTTVLNVSPNYTAVSL